MKYLQHLALTTLSFGLLSFLPTACDSSDGGSGTGGRRITLGAVVTSSTLKAPFTNSMGWNVSLTKAFVSTGAFYYYDGATIFSSNTPRRAPLDRLLDVVRIKTAFAHPGHYVPGNAMGQFLTPSSADLLTSNVLGTGDGVSGIVRSATFSFQTPAAGPFAGELGTHVAVLEGTATKGGDSRPFRAEIDAADIVNTENANAVEGCPFTETTMETDGTVTVTVAMTQWFDQVEFDSIPASTDGQPVLMPADAIGRNELVRGMKEGLAYVFSYAAK